MKVGAIPRKLNEFININAYLENHNLPKNSLCFTAEHGIGKTSVIFQYCKENNIGIEKISLSNIDDLGELSGIPCTEYELFHENHPDIEIWSAAKDAEEKIKLGYKLTGRSRTSYSEPKWVSNLRKFDTSILLLDDFSRAQGRFMNAVMDIINHGHYMGWELPKGCTVVLTANPEDKDYQVAYMDDAQKTRFFNFNVEIDVDSFIQNLYNEGVNKDFINFIIANHHEIFSKKSDNKDNERLSCPRQWSKLFYSLFGLTEYKSDLSKLTIFENSKAILNTYLANMFSEFLMSDMSKIPSTEDLFLSEKTNAVDKIKSIIGNFGSKGYRNDIANIICRRASMYCIKNSDDMNSCQKILHTLRDNNLVTKDHIYALYNSLYNDNKFMHQVSLHKLESDILKILRENE